VSSDPAVSAYTFSQLDSPRTVAEIGDALAAVQRESERMREEARRQGYDEGHAAGFAAARQQAAPALEAAGRAASELLALREQIISELEQDALQLAFDLAGQILAGAIDIEPERVLDVSRHALRHLTDRRHVTLIVHPDDLALLADSAAQLQGELGGIEHLAVQADRRVARGGAVARTDAGEIDAGLPVQLARARELVAEALAGGLPDAAALNTSLAAGGDGAVDADEP